MSIPFTAAVPSLLSDEPHYTNHKALVKPENLLRQWHMISSSSSLWQTDKRSVSITYQAASQSNVLDDIAAYMNLGSTKATSTKGISTPLGPNVYHWRGSGFLRLITTHWAVIGYGCMENSEIPVLVVWTDKTMFSPHALSIYYGEHRDLLGDEMQFITKQLRQLENAKINEELGKMRNIIS